MKFIKFLLIIFILINLPLKAETNQNLIVESQIHLVFINKKGKPVKVPQIIFDNFKPYFCDSIKL